MEKMGEDEFKGLEAEIDSAVDRLFVEKEREREEDQTMRLAGAKPPREAEKKTDAEILVSSAAKPLSFFKTEERVEPQPLPPQRADIESPIPSAPKPSSFFRTGERMEPQPLPPERADMESPIPSASKPSSLFRTGERTEPQPLPPERADIESPAFSATKPLSFLRFGERMESQLLSLEWEITKENLHSTQKEVHSLQKIMREQPQVTAILNLMEKVLTRMIENDENISPSWIKFLMDSKETMKLVMKKETGDEIDIYKRLAFEGIESRFLNLEGSEDIEAKQPALSPRKESEGEVATPDKKEGLEMLDKMSLFLNRMDETLKGMDVHLSELRQEIRRPPEQTIPEIKTSLVSVTVFKVDKKLFGVESDKVFRVFRAPGSFRGRDVDRRTIRLKDLKVRMIDLKRIFSIQEGPGEGEVKILTVKGNGEYKGLVVDEVLRKLSTRPNYDTESDEHFVGKVHWTYQQQQVEIPILNLKKF